MRMAGPDIVLFVVGALLFGGALTAIIVTQGPQAFTGTASASGAWTISYATSAKDLAKKSFADMSSAKTDFDVNGTNIASIKVKVTCTDTVPGGTFQMTVTVQGPGALKGSKSGGCGSVVEIPIPVQSVPNATSTTGATDADALASLPANPNATAGAGKWSVTVSGARSAPAGGPLPVPVGQTNPSGDVTLTVETFAPKATPVGGK